MDLLLYHATLLYTLLGSNGSPSDKVATDSTRLVDAYNKLKNNHTEELPQIIDKAKKHIDDLKAVYAVSKQH